MNMGMYWLFEYTWVCVFASVCLSVSLRLREDNGSGSAVRFFFFYKMMVVMKVMKSREIIKIDQTLTIPRLSPRSICLTLDVG